MRMKYNYLPFIVIFIVCIIVISLVNNFLTVDQQTTGNIVSSDVDKSQKDWFIDKVDDNERPNFPSYVDEYVEKYKIFVMGREEKELYMTFNCGYEYNNYTMDILNILKEENIQGAFFVTGEYLRDNPEIINRMVKEGHIVGNHGNTHANVSKLSAQEIEKEIVDFEDSYRQITGNTFSKKYYRPASGVYTEQVLAIAQKLGYTSVFWSMTYKDWETATQPGKDVAYTHMINDTHDGCILMLHTVSQSNIEALKDAIVNRERNGYAFKSLDEFPR